MNSTWLVGTLIGALIAAFAGIAIAVTRFANKSPEQREQDTAAFTAVTTGLSADYKRVRDERDQERLANLTFRAWALNGIELLRAYIRTLGHEPPDIGPQP